MTRDVTADHGLSTTRCVCCLSCSFSLFKPRANVCHFKRLAFCCCNNVSSRLRLSVDLKKSFKRSNGVPKWLIGHSQTETSLWVASKETRFSISIGLVVGAQRRITDKLIVVKAATPLEDRRPRVFPTTVKLAPCLTDDGFQ